MFTLHAFHLLVAITLFSSHRAQEVGAIVGMRIKATNEFDIGLQLQSNTRAGAAQMLPNCGLTAGESIEFLVQRTAFWN